jgi:hypothetical protein
MKAVLVALLLVFGLAAPTAAGDYSLENRPDVVFPPLKRGSSQGIVHTSPYPAGKRAASVWVSDACWHNCTSACAWQMEECIGTTGAADTCRPQQSACSRSCQLSCRTRGGPYVAPILGLVDF